MVSGVAIFKKIKECRKPLLYSLAVFFVLCVFSFFWYRRINDLGLFGLEVFGSALLALLVFLAASRLMESQKRQAVAFGITLTVSCLLFALAMPPFSAPDEKHHFYGTYWLSNMLMGQGEGLDSNPMPVRDEDKDLVDYMMWSAVEDGGLFEIDSGVFAAIDNVKDGALGKSEDIRYVTEYDFGLGAENSIAKIGSVLGLTLARLLDVGPLALFYLGRIGSIAFFVPCAVIAYCISPRFKNAFVITSLLPMTLHLVGSYSYDSGIIGISMLLVAFVLRAIYRDEKLNRFNLLAILMLAAAIAPCKLVYSVSVILIIFIPCERFSSKQACVAYKSAVFVACAASVIALRFVSVGNLVSSGSGLDYRGAESGHFYDLSTLITQPFATLKLYARTLVTYGEYYLFTMIGGSLGWLQQNLEAPTVLVATYGLIAFFGMQRTRFDDEKVSFLMRATCLVLFCASAAGIMLSMAIGHTFDTELVIMGVQGRYFLPTLPLFLIAMQSNLIAVRRLNDSGVLIASFSLLNALYLIQFLGRALLLP